MSETINIYLNHTVIYWSSPCLHGSKMNMSHSQHSLYSIDTDPICLFDHMEFCDSWYTYKEQNEQSTNHHNGTPIPTTNSFLMHLFKPHPTLLCHIIWPYVFSLTTCLQLRSQHEEVSSSDQTSKPWESFGWQRSSSWPKHRKPHRTQPYSW